MMALAEERVVVEGSDVRVPIGHGVGRMGQLGKIHETNTGAYIIAAQYVMCALGGYTEAEYDVLSHAFRRDIKDYELYNRYHALTVRKLA
ncbi:hypothetical protein TREMEDRAFT_71960 [Tremella mesenterica DSM 1558]|uniref:uncharacterized protein n=1 Tax=Tremella mesenterica (strain ATCC 24925 / CBS 8224 / DSM 1558 / NBRC 9311 / NRRL Y-6157 / RJB 2259-6 / UBC 559-6) TaxID=578456 RepID=UPI0003F4A497|nr:uncharacterized protein TREMEDRAFT_71960 [Tremella mesenterica DSM 1558]EIW68297.1 hypothetical protein TREMEDRAFT_71960 [Tremella mesenterica DSM 1558]